MSVSFLRCSVLVILLHTLAACSVVPSQVSGLIGGGADDVVDAQVRDSRAARTALADALSLLEAGDLVAADAAFTEMLAQGAKSPDALNHYAIFLREQWRIEEAEAVYQRALSASPNNAMTHWNLGILYEMYRGDYKQALAHFNAYQQFADAPDKRVAIWISDLSRRIAQQES